MSAGLWWEGYGSVVASRQVTLVKLVCEAHSLSDKTFEAHTGDQSLA